MNNDMERLSVQTGYCTIAQTSTNFDGSNGQIATGTFPDWHLTTPLLSTDEVYCTLYNQQVIDIGGSNITGKFWDSQTIRVEQGESLRASLGIYKDVQPSKYGFVRSYHMFTTKEMTFAQIAKLGSLTQPNIPSFERDEFEENQVIYGLCEEYESDQGYNTTNVFYLDWRMRKSFNNIIGNGYPVAQSRIFYTRVVFCTFNPTGYDPTNPALSPLQGIDIPACRVSLVGQMRKPKNFNDEMAITANNEGIGSW